MRRARVLVVIEQWGPVFCYSLATTESSSWGQTTYWSRSWSGLTLDAWPVDGEVLSSQEPGQRYAGSWARNRPCCTISWSKRHIG